MWSETERTQQLLAPSLRRKHASTVARSFPYASDSSESSGRTCEKIIACLARMAAAGVFGGMMISLLINTDRKGGGTYPIMLQQFRRALGVAAVRGNAKDKLGRLQYVRAKADEAAATTTANHSEH